MTDNIESIFPANDFKVVAENSKDCIDVGIIIGYDEDGDLCVFGGGLLGGRQPQCKDWLWIVESFKTKLVNGDFSEV